jgi:hypothetical protein
MSKEKRTKEQTDLHLCIERFEAGTTTFQGDRKLCSFYYHNHYRYYLTVLATHMFKRNNQNKFHTLLRIIQLTFIIHSESRAHPRS